MKRNITGQRKAQLSDKIIVEYDNYSVLCDEVYFNRKDNISPIDISYRGAELIMPIDSSVSKVSLEKVEQHLFHEIKSISPVDSKRQLLIEGESITFFASSMDKPADDYSVCYLDPVFESPLLEKIDLNWSTIGMRSYDRVSWSTILKIQKDSVFPRKISLLRINNVVSFFDDFEMVQWNGSYCSLENCNEKLLNGELKELSLKVNETNMCIWGSVSSSERVGEIWKKGHTGDYIYESHIIFFYKAFPTVYTFKSFVELLNTKYNGTDSQEEGYIKRMYNYDYYIKTINCQLPLKEFLDEYGFSYKGYNSGRY